MDIQHLPTTFAIPANKWVSIMVLCGLMFNTDVCLTSRAFFRITIAVGRNNSHTGRIPLYR